MEQAKKRPSIGVALGGGTARALAHVGALKVLEANKLTPHKLAGTSSGAIIAALYALGTPALALEHTLRNQNTLELWSQTLDFGLHKASLIHGKRFENWLDRKYFYGIHFKDLAVPLVIACTDVTTGKLTLLKEGPLAKAVVASCAFPGFFATVRSEERSLVDGGLVATVPFAALEDMDIRIGLHAGIDTRGNPLVSNIRKWNGSKQGNKLKRLLLSAKGENAWADFSRGLARVLDSYEQTVEAPQDALLVRINPPINWWDVHKLPEAIRSGEAAMTKALKTMPQLTSLGNL